MKATIYTITFLTIGLLFSEIALISAKSTTWNGSVSSSYSTSGNWSNGIPDSLDNITINSNAPNDLILIQNQKITNLTINGDTVDLGGFTFEITGTAYFNGGLVKNGLLKPSGSLCHFGGATLDARIEATCGYFHMNSGVYKKPVFLTSTGAATTSSTSGNHFEDSLTITNNGAVYFNMGSSGEDIYDGPVFLYNYSSKEIRLAATDTSYFNNHVTVNASSGGVEWGVSGGVSILASGKTISVGTFSSSYLTLTKFIQLGSTAQTLTLSGTGVVSLEGCIFNGNLTINAPGILTKTSTFYGNTIFNRTGSITNFHSYGSNVYAGNVTWDNAGSGGRIRLASTAPDTYLGDATFGSSGGQDLQVAYVGDNTFAGNITINSNKVVFNTSTGKVTFTGTNNQTLNGSYNYPFKKLAINKSAGTVTANTTLSVDDSLIFIQGNLITTSTNLLTMKHGSTANGASNSSFVSGPMKKIGNSAFVFNVGSGTTYRPLTITAPSNTSDAFTAEYFGTGQTLGTTKDTTITFVSDCGYWKLDRNVGSSNITPKFAFDSLHCDYLTVKPVHIALWNGTKWTDKGEAVTESSNKTTSSAMTSYGYFAFAYDLKPGDAPQFPLSVETSSTCSGMDVEFNQNEFWISFDVDSALFKFALFSPKKDSLYAPISRLQVFDNYEVGQNQTLVEEWSFGCDSIFKTTIRKTAVLDTSKQYLLKVSRYMPGDCAGINDTLDHFLNFCLMNIRTNPACTVHHYSSDADLLTLLGTLSSTPGQASNCDLVLNETGSTIVLGTTIDLPLLVEEGVTLAGNFDVLSETYSYSINGSILQPVTTTPLGTLISNLDKRGEYIFPGPLVSDAGLKDAGFMFYMMPGSVVRNLRIQGPMPGFQDFNSDNQLCAGIKVIGEEDATVYSNQILNCEIYNFSYAGVFIDQDCDAVEISKCHIHHVQGGGGMTSPKGYGVWVKGKALGEDDGSQIELLNNISNECKSAIDLDSDFINLTVLNNTFGNNFYEETVNGHQDNNIYSHPGYSTSCLYYVESSSSCSTHVCNTSFNIAGLGSGDIAVNNSIFHQQSRNENTISQIGIPYRYNPDKDEVYTIDVSQNTFAVKKDAPTAFSATKCNKGGYFKLANNYSESCTWDYERTHDVLGNSSSISPILKNELNSFDYITGVPVSSTSPQPPEFQMEFSATGHVPGFLPNSPSIPFISENDPNLELELTKGAYGSASQAYVLRAKTSLVTTPSIANGYNSYDGNQQVTGAQAGSHTVTYGDDEFWFDGTTLLPGLYGMDAMAVDATSNSSRHASKWVHKPVIIKPTDNYKFIFHIKDSYYSDLYGTTGVEVGVTKQVELNGHVIWIEDVADGGDDWERIELDLMNDIAPDGNTQIREYLNTRDLKNVLTFSIGILDPSAVGTGQIGGLRGLMVWVDDIYLKRFDSAENLCKDGDVESSDKFGLSTSPSPECMFYQTHSISFGPSCFSLDDAYNKNNYPIDQPSQIAKTASYLSGLDRKSGLQSILLKLDGIHLDSNFPNCSTYAFAPTPPANGAFISAGFDFDFKDFIGCDDYSDFGYDLAFSGTDPIKINSTITLDDNVVSGHNPNLILDRDLLIEYGGTLILEGINLMIREGAVDPIKITVESGGTLIIRCNATNPVNLFACGDMWQGIVNLGGDIFITEPCNDREPTIWDAEAAISSTGGKVDLRYVQFKENYIGVELKDGNFVYPTGIPIAIRAVDFNASGGLISKEPHLGQQSHAHIILDNVSDIVIGDAPASNTGTFTNNFSMAEYGIRATNSKATILNNAFTSINATTNSPLNCTFCGSCIYFENTDNVDRELIIGGVYNDGPGYEWTAYLKNNINNSKNGIIIRGDQSALIQSNEFTNLYQGIRCNRNLFDVTINEENKFSDVNFGITLFNVRNNILIDGNIFNDPKDDYENLSFSRTAISVHNSNLAGASANWVNITNNEISEYRIAIQGLNSPITSISGNIIQFNLSNSLTNYHGGIWLQNCPAAFVSDNDISNTEFLPDLNFRGIDIENSLNCDINCNNIENMGIGINFDGLCNDTELRQNTMSGFDIGININNAMIDLNQGTPTATNSETAWDNVWSTEPGYTYKVGGQLLGNPGQITWFHRFADDNMEPYSPNPFQGLIVDPEDGQNSASITCASVLVNSGSRVEEFGPVVGDTLSYEEYAEENTYLARTIAYQAMKLDSTIIYQGDSLDADFEAFFERHDSTNIGKFYLVKSLFEREPDSAMTILGAIVAENSIESHIIEHYVRTQEITDRGDELSSADSAFYMERTTGLPTTDGAVYYYGLGNLFIEQHIPIISARHGQQANIQQHDLVNSNNSELIVFPNPTSGLMTIRCSDQKANFYQIEIYNAVGELIISKHIVNNYYLLDMSPYNQGIYFIRAVDKSKKYYTKTFNLLK